MSDCSCVWGSDGFGELATLSKKIVEARKSHRCGECGREIVPTEKYEYYTVAFDGKVATHKTCSDCLSLRDSGLFCQGFVFNEIWNDFFQAVRQTWGEQMDWTALSKLTPAAKEKAFSFIEEQWGFNDG